MQIKEEAKQKVNWRLRSAANNFKKKRKARRQGTAKYKQGECYQCVLKAGEYTHVHEIEEQQEKQQEQMDKMQDEIIVLREELTRYKAEKEQIEHMFNDMVQAATATVETPPAEDTTSDLDAALLTALAQDFEEVRAYMAAEKKQDRPEQTPSCRQTPTAAKCEENSFSSRSSIVVRENVWVTTREPPNA